MKNKGFHQKNRFLGCKKKVFDGFGGYLLPLWKMIGPFRGSLFEVFFIGLWVKNYPATLKNTTTLVVLGPKVVVFTSPNVGKRKQTSTQNRHQVMFETFGAPGKGRR